MAEEHQGNGGWPVELNDAPPSYPELPARPTYREMAEGYATAALADRSWRPAVVRALRYLRDGLSALRDEVRDGFARLERAITATPVPRSRRPLPSLAQYNPDLTPGQGIRLEADAWQALQAQVAELTETTEQLERERDMARARAEGAASVVAEINRKSEAKRARIALLIAGASLLGGGFDWLLHYLHVMH